MYSNFSHGYINEEMFFDTTEKNWFYLKNLKSVIEIEKKMKSILNKDKYLSCIGMVLSNSLYSEKNDKQFCYLMDKWIEIQQKSGEIPRDACYRHPFLHELSHQLPRTINKFKHTWMTDFYKKYWENDDYKDEYGGNSKQRLSHSIDKWNMTEELEEWIRDNIGVKPCKLVRGNEYGIIIQPSKEEYSV